MSHTATDARVDTVPGIDLSLFPRVHVRTPLPQSLHARLVGSGCSIVDDPTAADVQILRATEDGATGLPTLVLIDAVPATGSTLGVGVAESTARGPITAVAAEARPWSVVGPDAPAVGLDLLARVDPENLTATAALLPGDHDRPLLHQGSSVVATVNAAERRIVLALDGDIAELVGNAVMALARPHAGSRARDAVDLPAWTELRAAVTAFRLLQATDGSVPAENASQAAALVVTMTTALTALVPDFSHDHAYLTAAVGDLTRWSETGFGVPDFLDSLQQFHPERQRVDGLRHVVLFPMYTQNGNPDRNLEAVLVEVIWPEFVADLEAGDYSNKLFVPIRFVDFTAGYDTNSAVLFPETIAMREVPSFTWGGIFADREAARFRRVLEAAAGITRLDLPPDAARLLTDQTLAEQTFVTWDLIHDRTHMRGDLPFDPFMIKQRMPFFLYTLEEMRCDLTAFREAVKLEEQGLPHARLVQYAILFDRIFRFSVTGGRVRNYDGLGGQLLFAWLHQRHVLNWTDNRLTVDWPAVTEPVLELGRMIEDLYWRSIDRPKMSHWLAAYDLVAGTVTPHPASTWAKGPEALPLDGPPKGLTDAMLPDEFPLSMFFEALSRKLKDVIDSTAGITGN